MSDITLESLLSSWWEYQKRSIFTAIPARVVGVRDIEQGRLDVQPLINTVFADFEDDIEWPTILSVPVMWPSSSTTAITFPINNGDTVLLVFSQKSTDVFKSGDGTPQPPSDYRVFDKRDAVAIPGLWPFGMSKNKKSSRTLTHSTDDMVIAHNIGTEAECEIRLKPTGEVKITSPLKVDITAPVTTITSTTSASVVSPLVNVTSTLGVVNVTSLNTNITATGAITTTAPIVNINGTTAVAVVSPTFTWNTNTVAVV